MNTLTLFNAEGINKNPKSRYPDGSFIFVNKEFQTIKESLEFIAGNHILTRHLDLESPVKINKTSKDLKEFSSLRLNCIVFEIIDITNSTYYNDIIQYFKDKKYSIGIMKAKGWDGLYNFNIRILLRTNITNSEKTIKYFLEEIQGKGKIDFSCLISTSSLPPIYSDIIYVKEKGKIISDSDMIISGKVLEDIEEENLGTYFTKELQSLCIDIFISKGYSLISKNKNDSFSFSKNDNKEYFWYISSPFLMNNKNTKLKESIFKELANTKVGKQFLKDRTKDNQSSKLLSPLDTTKYKEVIITDERYLDFEDKTKIDLIDKFLDSNKGVLKFKSAMGTAKSSGIKVIIDKAHERKEKVIIVSNRISVAKDFAEKYNMMLYSNPDSFKYKGSLVVQYDSLHRYNISNYDVVIFDEFISLLLHHRANLTDNANINAVKFKILMDSKKVLVADAFLTGYEDIFFNRDIYAILNEYKDSTQLFEYKNKEFFISSIIQRCISLEKDQHISCSFTSLNVMRVVEMELKEAGVKVVSLSSDTSSITRDIIYRRFKEDTHSAFDVILFTPTLTVGVSNLNNVVAHFHYDSGMSTDVISSLQMIKRSRSTDEIHYYLDERQFYYNTDINELNQIAEKNINTFYNKKDKTLLVDIDYTTGNLILTPLARYINQIEVLYNILTNNHYNAFKILLNYQFNSSSEIIDTVDKSWSLRSKVQEIREKVKEETLSILNEYSDITWDTLEIEDIRSKIGEKTKEEQVKLLLGTVQEKFKKELSKEDLFNVTLLEIENDFRFISKIQNMKIVSSKNDDYTRYKLSKAISSDISSLQNKKHIDFLEYLLIVLVDGRQLCSSYSLNDIKAIDKDLNKEPRFEKFLKKLGYQWTEARLKVNKDILKYLDYK